MELGIKGKNALVTGGATGIGRAIALGLASEGANVVITSRNEKNIKETLEMLKPHGGNYYSVLTGLTDEDGPKQLMEEVWAKFGQIDIVVNNAGDTLNVLDPYCPISDWRRIFRLNMEVMIEINNFCIPHMKKQDWGRLLNVTAGAAMENSGPVPYCSSKAATTAYTRSMGRILAIETDNVVMAALLPGVVLTEEGHWSKVLQDRPEHAEKYLAERTPLGRFGKPSEMVPMALLLCSELATFYQASVVLVDAGQAKHYVHVGGIGN